MNDRAERDRKKFLESVDGKMYLKQLEDGFYYFWPVFNCGAFESHHLRWIADELDRRNKPLIDQIENDPLFKVSVK